MNNLLNYNEYFNRHLEEVVYDELTEGTGIRGFINKTAEKKIKAELADEIEMSKSIMDGITTGLDSLNDNFDAIKKGIEADDDKNIKGEKQKKLDEITKLLEDSRKQTWDLNQLIDEGEIDYAGFTANVGMATATYFGILLFPMRAAVIVHKGYNYFFNLVKNTIRKALVMLQMNFDQFQNLIIYHAFQSTDYINDVEIHDRITDFYSKMDVTIFGDKHGTAKNLKNSKKIEQQLKAFKQQFDQEMALDKNKREANPYNGMLDQYNNTYTKSLETLRTYSQEDVQKQLDAIKNSMNKLAAGDVDLQAYGELIIATAEEHAYKVSSSIYSKFAKMTEVFSLPNQKKMIDLIQAATEEENKMKSDAVKKAKDKMKTDAVNDAEEELEKSATDILNKISGVKIGSGKKSGDKGDITKYEYSDIDVSGLEYSEFKKLKEDDQDTVRRWLQAHTDILEKCPKSLRTVILPIGSTTGGFFDYVDSLVDVVGPTIGTSDDNKKEKKSDKNDDKSNESLVLDFDSFILEGMKKQTTDEIDSIIDKSDKYADLLTGIFGENTKGSHKLTISEKSYKKLNNLCIRLGERMKDEKNDSKKENFKKWHDELDEFLEYLRTEIAKIKEERAKKKEEEVKKNPNKSDKKSDNKVESYDDEIIDFPDDSHYKGVMDCDEIEVSGDAIEDISYFIDLRKVSEYSARIKDMYTGESQDVAIAAFEEIGNSILNDRSFTNMSKNFVDDIVASYNEGKLQKEHISVSTYLKLKDSIVELNKKRKSSYSEYLNDNTETNTDKDNKKSEE